MFDFFWYHFFLLSQFSRRNKIQIYIGINTAATYCSLILKLKQCQKALFVLNFLEISTHAAPENILDSIFNVSIEGVKFAQECSFEISMVSLHASES